SHVPPHTVVSRLDVVEVLRIALASERVDGNDPGWVQCLRQSLKVAYRRVTRCVMDLHRYVVLREVLHELFARPILEIAGPQRPHEGCAVEAPGTRELRQ